MEITTASNLSSSFSSVEIKINNLSSGKIDRNDENVNNIILELETLQRIIESEGLFSKNEELEDFSTSSIKYLSIKYYLGKVNTQMSNLYLRKTYLLKAKRYFLEFIEMCKEVRMLKEEELSLDMVYLFNPFPLSSKLRSLFTKLF
jgi:hypothetical protein